jgi:hypothetical protein
MAETGHFSHTGRDGSTPFSRMAAAGYRGTMMGENIARGFTSPAAVMNAWMNSPGHRANILNDGFTDLGVGIAGTGSGMCWVQNFGASQGPVETEVEQAPRPVGPTITGVAPYYGRPGDPITITGQRFGTRPGTVRFSGGRSGETSSWFDDRIGVTIPQGALTGPLYVQTEHGTSPGAHIYVLAPAPTDPILQRVSPAFGGPGTLVTLYGQHLGTTEGTVTFNGVRAPVTHWSPTGLYVACLVPQGASNGPVKITRGADNRGTNVMSFTVPTASTQPAPPPTSIPITRPPSNVSPAPVDTNPPAPTLTRPTLRQYRYRFWYVPRQ